MLDGCDNLPLPPKEAVGRQATTTCPLGRWVRSIDHCRETYTSPARVPLRRVKPALNMLIKLSTFLLFTLPWVAFEGGIVRDNRTRSAAHTL
jgi:hypothetical protein